MAINADSKPDIPAAISDMSANVDVQTDVQEAQSMKGTGINAEVVDERATASFQDAATSRYVRGWRLHVLTAG